MHIFHKYNNNLQKPIQTNINITKLINITLNYEQQK